MATCTILDCGVCAVHHTVYGSSASAGGADQFSDGFGVESVTSLELLDEEGSEEAGPCVGIVIEDAQQ